MPEHALLKSWHVAFAALSGALFLLRFALAGGRGVQPRGFLLRAMPHVVDTLLLGLGVVLAWQLGVAGTRAWLPAKLVAIAAYIVLGSIALKRGRTRSGRGAAFVGACLAFAYVVGVALTRRPAWPLPPFLS
jgi:uncharacterized membrane protein SirB2